MNHLGPNLCDLTTAVKAIHLTGHATDSDVGLLQSGKPFLGICLGLQLLFEGSEENGGVEGLGIIPGQVTKFEPELNLPVPHIGWNGVKRRYAS